ncbi:MAG: hypothetical protein ACRCZI_04760, partial [Cetobacterium sp.]
EPAYNLTVDRDHCYYVKGEDGRAYLVANSSHPSDAFRTMAVTWKASKITVPEPANLPIATRMPTFGEAKKYHFERKQAMREGYL